VEIPVVHLGDLTVCALCDSVTRPTNDRQQPLKPENAESVITGADPALLPLALKNESAAFETLKSLLKSEARGF
jgi:hypothetical protein